MARTTFSVGDKVEHTDQGRGVVQGVAQKNGKQTIAVDVDRGTYIFYTGYVSTRGWTRLADDKPVPAVVLIEGDVSPVPPVSHFDIPGDVQAAKVANSVAPDPIDPEPSIDDPRVKEVVRKFAFDSSSPQQCLWIVHRFVVGEPVSIRGNENWRGHISDVRFSSGLLVVTVRTIDQAGSLGDIFDIYEKRSGKLPLMPIDFQPNEEVFHPKYGSGVVLGCERFTETDKGVPVVQFKSGEIIVFPKGKKLRRIHVSPEPREFPQTR